MHKYTFSRDNVAVPTERLLGIFIHTSGTRSLQFNYTQEVLATFMSKINRFRYQKTLLFQLMHTIIKSQDVKTI